MIVQTVTHNDNNEAYSEPRNKVQGLIFPIFGVSGEIRHTCRIGYAKNMKLGLENKHTKRNTVTSKKM